VVVLYADFFNTFALSILRFIGDGRNLGIAAAVLFAVFGVGYTIIAIVLFVYAIWKKKWGRKSLLLLTQAVAGLLYYIGDNLPRLLLMYGTVIDCDEACTNNANAAGFGLLAIGGGIYFFSTINKISTKVKKKIKSENNDNDDNSPTSYLVMMTLLTLLTDCDLLYTAVSRVESTNCPSPSYTYASWAYWAGLTFLLATPAIFWIINTREAKGKVDRLVANISGIVIVLILAFYLLADNELPLSCTVGEFTENTTIVNSSDEQRITETRFAFWVVILVLHAPLVAANIAGKCYYRYCETGYNRPVN